MSDKAADEETPLVKDENKSSKWAMVRAAKNLGILGGLQVKHNKMMELAKQSTGSNVIHGDDKKPTEEEQKAAAAAFIAAFGLLFLAVAGLFLLIGGLAVYFSMQHPPGDPCPYPLSKCLAIYGCMYIAMALFFCITPCCPSVAILSSGVNTAAQIMNLVLLVLTLIAYEKAEICGKTLWWACLIFGNWIIAACVFCCCNPFAAKGTSALLFTKAMWVKVAEPHVTLSKV